MDILKVNLDGVSTEIKRLKIPLKQLIYLAAKSKLIEKIEDVIACLESLPFGELAEIKRGQQPAKVLYLS
jgi:hypothetical protein